MHLLLLPLLLLLLSCLPPSGTTHTVQASIFTLETQPNPYANARSNSKNICGLREHGFSVRRAAALYSATQKAKSSRQMIKPTESNLCNVPSISTLPPGTESKLVFISTSKPDKHPPRLSFIPPQRDNIIVGHLCGPKQLCSFTPWDCAGRHALYSNPDQWRVLQAQQHGGIILAVHMTHSKLELFQIWPKAFHTLQDCRPSSAGNFLPFFQWCKVALLQGVIVVQ